jgi:hypothetical protein
LSSLVLFPNLAPDPAQIEGDFVVPAVGNGAIANWFRLYRD